jgi:hypothetical protein
VLLSQWGGDRLAGCLHVTNHVADHLADSGQRGFGIGSQPRKRGEFEVPAGVCYRSP